MFRILDSDCEKKKWNEYLLSMCYFYAATNIKPFNAFLFQPCCVMHFVLYRWKKCIRNIRDGQRELER